MNEHVEDSIIINLNSVNGILLNETMKSNIQFNTNGLLSDDNNILYSEISLLNCEIPCSFYAINNNNNLLNYSISGIVYNITIPIGNYNANTLITALTTSFTTLNQSFTITISQITGLLTFSYTNDFSFINTSTCKQVLGFDDTITSTSSTLTLPYQLNLLGPTQIKIVSKALNPYNYDTETCLLGVIQVNVPFYSLLTWENKTGHKNILRINYLDNIDIQLYDQDDNLLDFNNIDWTITLRLIRHRIIFFSLNTLHSSISEHNNKKHLN
jgi:hypothetical protein